MFMTSTAHPGSKDLGRLSEVMKLGVRCSSPFLRCYCVPQCLSALTGNLIQSHGGSLLLIQKR